MVQLTLSMSIYNYEFFLQNFKLWVTFTKIKFVD